MYGSLHAHLQPDAPYLDLEVNAGAGIRATGKDEREFSTNAGRGYADMERDWRDGARVCRIADCHECWEVLSLGTHSLLLAAKLLAAQRL